eukprot:gb/GEZN01003274.1/.p1 GENE.gb/GEZN01003274.1/~~gb/GEZN01003274.1/.p1  ORF type:complete len:621 (-),score=86.37 gb/GEZN01003274.1/:332-2194(-)
MCGILAILGIHATTEADVIKLRKRALECSRRNTHRGPDWSGIHLSDDKKNMILHERLSIVDVTGGSQPLYSRDRKVVLGVNGELYNHTKLEAEIKDCNPITASDCEVIIHLYNEAKEKKDISPSKWLNRIVGMFAFALVDDETGDFVVARDHIGIIPLYIGIDRDGNLWVASELKVLHDQCIWFTEFKPGHFLFANSRNFSFSSTNLGMEQWYKPAWYDPEYMPTQRLDKAKLRKGLEEAVIRHLMCDVPYAVLLSGGLDSSLIAALAAKHCAERVEEAGSGSSAWYPRLHTCSIGLKHSPDLAAARIVAKHLNSVHHEFTYTIEEGLDARSEAIRMMETFDPTTIRAGTPMYLLARRIKSMGIKMVLSGEGADECFGGYLYFHKCPSEVEFQKECCNKLKELNKFDCLRANKAMMAWGVEARVPFLDRQFLDYAMDIAPIDKMCGTLGGKEKETRMEKWCLREALGDLLPLEVAWRQKEQFSDGVGYGWIDAIRDYAEAHVTDQMLETSKFRFPYCPPVTKEAYWNRMIYEQHFPPSLNNGCSVLVVPGGPSVACSTAAAIRWDASFSKFADCSGRSVAGVHVSAVDDTYKNKVKQVKREEEGEGAESNGQPATKKQKV